MQNSTAKLLKIYFATIKLASPPMPNDLKCLALPVTCRVTIPLVLPCMLVAVHMYCPESVCTRSLIVRVQREFVLARDGRGWRLARVQTTLNGPGPLTSQVNITVCPTGSSTLIGPTSTTGSSEAVYNQIRECTM